MVRNSKGLTLVELMVVLAIVGIMTAMAIPMLGITPQARLKSAARDIVSNMQAARMNALRDGKTWRVEFDTGNKQYKVSYCNSTTCEGNAHVVQKTLPLYDGSASARIAFGSGYGNATGSDCNDPAGGLCFGAAGDYVSFTSLGTSFASSLYIMDTKTKDTIQIRIANTGRTHIWTNFGRGWNE